MTLRRHPASPILTRDHVPPCPPRILDPSSAFNPGAVHVESEVRLLIRVQTRGRETYLVPARSKDGVVFDVAEEPARIVGLDRIPEPVFHVYDPRITKVGDDLIVVAALDTASACRLAVFRSNADLDRLVMVSYSEDDLRNGVLFPDRVGGRYLRLERPNRRGAPGDPASGDEVRLAESDDLIAWHVVGTVMKGRPHRWDERIGSGPPPLKTREGWLHLYHGVATHFASVGVYQVGAVLLDLADPTRVLARTRENLLEPREPWEMTGQVPNVVFPTGIVAPHTDADGFARLDSRVLVYYGAADTCIGVAETTVMELIDACRPS